MWIQSDSLPSARGRRRLAALVLLAAVWLGVTAAPAAAAGDRLPEGVVWTATVNDANVERTSSDDPARLEPGTAEIVVRIENSSSEPVEVPFVRLEGTVLGLTLYSYAAQVDFRLAPGQRDEREIRIPLLALQRQADGLIPSRLALLDADGGELSGKDLTVDVSGELTSVYGVFGTAVGAITLLLLAGALWRLATGRLHPNRWRRALALAAPGLGLGFLLTFTLSAVRVTTPDARLWATLVVGGALVGFAAGYLTPTPADADDDPDPAAAADAGEPAVAADPGEPTVADLEPVPADERSAPVA